MHMEFETGSTADRRGVIFHILRNIYLYINNSYLSFFIISIIISV